MSKPTDREAAAFFLGYMLMAFIWMGYICYKDIVGALGTCP